MADVFKVVFLVLGVLAVLVAYWLAAGSLSPRWVERARAAYGDRGIRCTVVGILATVPLVLASIGLFKAGGGMAALGALVLSVPVLLSLAGSAGLALRLGDGLVSAGDDGTTWRRLLRGGMVLALTFLLPIIGWFLVFPWVLLSGVGASIDALRRSRQPSPRPAPSLP